MQIAVVGLGYVGLTTAVGLTAIGHRVVGVDTDCRRVNMLKAGKVPMHEPGLQAGLREYARDILITASLDEALATKPEIVMIAVQTPAEPNGPSDASFVEGVARDIGRGLTAPATIVVRSTAPLGTTARVREIASAEYGVQLAVAANPEFLSEGKAYEAFLQPDRVVVGVDEEATAAQMRRVYARLDAPLIVTDIVTAELSKYAANAFLATQISFINELADLAAAAGADISSISRILKLDKRVGEHAYLSAGLGYGGSCLPKDLRTLADSAQQLGVDMRLARAVTEVNDERATRVVDQLTSAIGDVGGKRIAIWGLAFKGGTSDVRESPAILVARRLIEAGAEVRAYDPLAEDASEPLLGIGTLCDGMYEPLEDADALVVLTDCRDFATPDYAEMQRRMRLRVIVDGRNVLDSARVRAAGFRHIGVSDPGNGTRATPGAKKEGHE
jgi:UDPglucose 6-dehydrogenase